MLQGEVLHGWLHQGRMVKALLHNAMSYKHISKSDSTSKLEI